MIAWSWREMLAGVAVFQVPPGTKSHEVDTATLPVAFDQALHARHLRAWLVDLRGRRSFDARRRRVFIDWVERRGSQVAMRVRVIVVLVESADHEEALRKLAWLAPMPVPVLVHYEMAPAMASARAAVLAADWGAARSGGDDT